MPKTIISPRVLFPTTHPFHRTITPVNHTHFRIFTESTMVKFSSLKEKNCDGYDVTIYKWEPDSNESTITGAVQIVHGMAEHARRYDHFAEYLVNQGFIVFSSDNMGHGESLIAPEKWGFLGESRYMAVVMMVHRIFEIMEPLNLPLVLFGHSWGSMLSQCYIQTFQEPKLAGCILSGTSGADPLAKIGKHATKLVSKIVGEDKPAGILYGMTDGSFNKNFEPGETGVEWLSRDPQVCRAFIDDPKCGNRLPNVFYENLALLTCSIWEEENEKKIRKDLPIYLFAGSEDPVGHQTKTIKKLIDRYTNDYGIASVDYKFYEGGRHEMLNEINKEEVYADTLAKIVEFCSKK